jgi:hypothetical protein
MITAQKTLLRIQMGVIAAFLMVKFFFRPIVLESRYEGVLKIFVLSFPNFCEAVAGTIFLTFAFLLLKDRFFNTSKLQEEYLYLIAILFAGVYVILQEFKIHNLGGNNTYDPYDVLFSIIGLVSAYGILSRLRPKIIDRLN